jgi:hypothetical protein
MKSIRGTIVMEKNDENTKRYKILRNTYHAEGAFPNIDEKVKLRLY